MGKNRNKKANRKLPVVSSVDLEEQVVSDVVVTSAVSGLKAEHQALLAAKDWAGLRELSQRPLANYPNVDKEAVKTLQAYATLFAIGHGEEFEAPTFPSDDRPAYSAAISHLLNVDVDFLYNGPFKFYVENLHYPAGPVVLAFKQTQTAFASLSDSRGLEILRAFGLRISAMRVGWYDAEEDEKVVLDSAGDVAQCLVDAVDKVAKSSGNISEEKKLVFRIYRTEALLAGALDFNLAPLFAAFDELSIPAGASVEEALDKESADGALQRFTPDCWKFVAELQHIPLAKLARLVEARAPSFRYSACDGLAYAGKSVCSRGAHAEEFLSLAVKQFARGNWNPYGPMGSTLYVPINGVLTEFSPSFRDLFVPRSAGELLKSIAAQAGPDFALKNELVALARIVDARDQYGELSIEDGPVDSSLPGLLWLAEQSANFELLAATVMVDFVGQIALTGHAIRCFSTSDEQLASGLHVALYAPDDFTEKDVRLAAQTLLAVKNLNLDMPPEVAKLWRDLVKQVFDVCMPLGGKSRKVLLDLARELRQEMSEMKLTSVQAYLEMTVGSRTEAFALYLRAIEETETVGPNSATHAKSIVNGSEDAGTLAEYIELLELAESETRHPEAIAVLLSLAHKKQQVLVKDNQFHLTALNRWPSLSAQARKLLGVFSNITQYNSIEELGLYANMDAKWTNIHYKKLVDAGMLLVSEDGFRINPHIAPLIEQESRHAVVGRIIRSSGSSTVKQVFNSQREFSIYQVVAQLCPNHLVFPNSALQAIMSYDKVKELVDADTFGYYLRASVDIVVVSSTTYLPMLAIEVDSVWHDAEAQKIRDDKKDELFSFAGIPFLRLRPMGNPSESTIRGQVAEHLDLLVNALRKDAPGFDQALALLENLSAKEQSPA